MGNSPSFRGAAAGVVGVGLWTVSRGIDNAGAHVGSGIVSAGAKAIEGLKHGGDSIASGIRDAQAGVGMDIRSGVKDIIGCAFLLFIGIGKWSYVSVARTISQPFFVNIHFTDLYVDLSSSL